MIGYKSVAALVLLSAIFCVSAALSPRPKYVNCPANDPLDHVVFFPHETNCSEFYRCDHGGSILEFCPAGLHWNPKLDTCDWPWHAGCSPGGGNNGCDGGDGGDGCPAGKTPTCPNPDPALSVFFPHENDCHWFYHCSNGVAYCKQCPAGLNWNVKLNTCDWPWNAGCTAGNGGGSGGSGGNGGGNGGHDGGTGAYCPVPQPNYPIYFPDPNNCSVFYECSFGTAYQLKCPAGLYFNPQLDVCDAPEHSGCSASGGNSGGDSGNNGGDGSNGGNNGPTTSAPIATTPKPQLGACPSATPPDCPYDDVGLSVFYPHPSDSHYFYHCSHGVAYCKVCPSPLKWNQSLQTCNW